MSHCQCAALIQHSFLLATEGHFDKLTDQKFQLAKASSQGADCWLVLKLKDGLIPCESPASSEMVSQIVSTGKTAPLSDPKETPGGYMRVVKRCQLWGR